MNIKNVKLRAFELDDFTKIHAWRNDPEIQGKTGGLFRYVSTENEKKWIEDKITNNQKQFYWGICIPEGKLIGYIGFTEIDWINRTALYNALVIGESKYRNLRYSKNALLQSLKYLFYQVGINRVWAYAINDGSIMLCKLAGFKKEGTLRQAVYKNGRYMDATLVGLLRDDFEKKHPFDEK